MKLKKKLIDLQLHRLLKILELLKKTRNRSASKLKPHNRLSLKLKRKLTDLKLQRQLNNSESLRKMRKKSVLKQKLPN